MWKRDEASKPVAAPAQAVAPGGETAGRVTGRNIVNIGKSVVIKGELSGNEDLTIEGEVEGRIELNQHVLTIGSHGRIRAEISGKSVVVLGEVIGNIAATDKVAIRDNGSVEGDIAAPKVAIAEGANFRGGIDMSQQAATSENTVAPPQAGASSEVAAGKSGKPMHPKGTPTDGGVKKAGSGAAVAQ
ncbi:MAG: cell shape determination protein CcmA [Acidobacteria bacterium]|nr:cell shape determination protein CcmA [Acidobacteriota bacterium]|tara:strand:+ start:310 stop:870 length:561 start_codon:yes stop_codon:yes gene_type:complete